MAMGILGGSDDRTPVADVTAGNFANVVAVDAGVFIANPFGSLENVSSNPVSGYLIGPQHVLTAAHGMEGANGTRVTTSSNVTALPSQANPATSFSPVSVNVTNNNTLPTDMALLTLNENLTTPDAVLGLLTFVQPSNTINLPIVTAGYPWNITQPDLSANTDPTGRTQCTLQVG